MRRPWGLPFVPLYGAGVWAKNLGHDRRWAGVRRLEWPVVSVGSLSAGGAGKTPVVIALAGLLARHGIRVDVLSRGYGRTSAEVAPVDAEGSAAEFGDEPLEMARAGLDVFVGADRFAAGRLAEARTQAEACAEAGSSAALRDDKQNQTRIHLLDDGFQHRRLARGLDIVLLTEEDARDWLLPAGNLREPLSALRRSDVVVLRDEEADALRPVVAAHTAAEVWGIRRRLVLPEGPRKLFAFCGIARPDGFFSMLGPTAGMRPFPDHHRYTSADVAGLVRAAQALGAEGFVTTAKDATKLTHEALAALGEVGPVQVAQLTVTLLDEEPVLRRVRRLFEPA